MAPFSHHYLPSFDPKPNPKPAPTLTLTPQVLLAALVYPCYRDRSFDLRAKPVGDPSTSATVRLGDLVALCGTLGERNCDYSLGKIA